MEKPYLPPSPFLRLVKDGRVELSEESIGEKGLRKLVALTSDSDEANRDWAVFLLSQLDLDTDEIRKALLKATTDPEIAVRSEAILGIALRDRKLALPLVRDALSSPVVYAPVFEAAEIVAHPALIEGLRSFAEPSDNPYLDQLAQDALKACGGT